MATHSSVLAWRIPGIGGAWWAAVYGVAQSRTQLKRLSSSSSVEPRKMVTDEPIRRASVETQTQRTNLGTRTGRGRRG